MHIVINFVCFPLYCWFLCVSINKKTIHGAYLIINAQTNTISIQQDQKCSL